MIWTIVKEAFFITMCWWLFMTIYDKANGIPFLQSARDRGITLLFGSWWFVKITALILVLWLLNTLIPIYKI